MSLCIFISIPSIYQNHIPEEKNLDEIKKVSIKNFNVYLDQVHFSNLRSPILTYLSGKKMKSFLDVSIKIAIKLGIKKYWIIFIDKFQVHLTWVKLLRMQGHHPPATLVVTGLNPGLGKINSTKNWKNTGFLTLK
jgi:hypothetical protein